MPALPRLAAPPSPAVARSARPAPPTMARPPRAPYFSSSSWNRWRCSPRWPSATAADAPRGGPLPELEEPDHLILAALRAARIRDEESRRPDPLFIDPYAAVLSHDVARHDMDYLVSHSVPCQDHYRLTTRYIDDKLQNLISNSEDIRQIVLLTDGMDTRPYRLSWPRLSVVYDVSPGKVFSTATQQLRGSGAKVSRNCVLLHTPLESPDLQENLSKNGFNGNRLSLWILQLSHGFTAAHNHEFGKPLACYKQFSNERKYVRRRAAPSSRPTFINGHAPLYNVFQGLEQDNLEKLFFIRGFRVSFVQYDDVAKDIGLDIAAPWQQHGRVLFVAEQLRFSDAQVRQRITST
ncbi:hypothetical protein HU200_015694 [Digitaria exilis]|uniref:S-adenosyl-L-methionine-dependent methyltransferase n=1 Tax=Digitaria exilis TaxID=1010633 RepID=A0A835F973_9POAL|nr:hypothetical protein HU200_015694 [Digitaria exilis]